MGGEGGRRGRGGLGQSLALLASARFAASRPPATDGKEKFAVASAWSSGCRILGWVRTFGAGTRVGKVARAPGGGIPAPAPLNSMRAVDGPPAEAAARPPAVAARRSAGR